MPSLERATNLGKETIVQHVSIQNTEDATRAEESTSLFMRFVSYPIS